MLLHNQSHRDDISLSLFAISMLVPGICRRWHWRWMHRMHCAWETERSKRFWRWCKIRLSLAQTFETVHMRELFCAKAFLFLLREFLLFHLIHKPRTTRVCENCYMPFGGVSSAARVLTVHWKSSFTVQVLFEDQSKCERKKRRNDETEDCARNANSLGCATYFNRTERTIDREIKK